MTLFSATLIAKDRESAFLQRLYTTPLRPVDYILGYALPILPISLAQGAICFVFAWILGLPLSWGILYALLGLIPVSFLFIALGLLFGSVLNVKAVGGICGALLTNLTAWLSGVWFDLSLVGGAFERIANALPFAHIVRLERALLACDFREAASNILIPSIYILLFTVLSILLFMRQMKRQ